MTFGVLTETKLKIESIIRVQNRFKSPIPNMADLLSKSSTEIYSLNRLLHCVVPVEPRKSSKSIPQRTNCQRFSHTKKIAIYRPGVLNERMTNIKKKNENSSKMF